MQPGAGSARADRQLCNLKLTAAAAAVCTLSTQRWPEAGQRRWASRLGNYRKEIQ